MRVVPEERKGAACFLVGLALRRMAPFVALCIGALMALSIPSRAETFRLPPGTEACELGNW